MHDNDREGMGRTQRTTRDDAEAGDEQELHVQVENLRRWLRTYAQAEQSGHAAPLTEPVLATLEETIEALRVSDDDLRLHLDSMRRNAARMEQERARYRELLDLSPDAYLLTDLEATILDANAAAAELVGVDRAELTGRPLSMYVDTEDKTIFWEWLADLQTANHPLQWEMRLLVGGEMQRHVVVRARHATDAPELRWMLRDISERIRAEETERRLRRERAERQAADAAAQQARATNGRKTILFVDEVHRFNKSQQDALLGAVEKGIIRLIGATTENPSFEVNAALLSRCQVFTLNALGKEELEKMLHAALEKDSDLKKRSIQLKETDALLRISGGDGRKLLNLLEITVDGISEEPCVITNDKVMEIAQQRISIYDKSGEQHYDIVSAFIKSIRGSDPNAAVYYMARMIEGGEDVKFIARRLLILASEDIGNANPTALVIASNCFQAVTFIGYPEAEIILSQCATYLASSPKSNASYMAIKGAKQLVRETGDLPVPMHLRNAPTKLMKDQGYGKGYKYAHDFEQNFVAQEYLPDAVKGQKLYDPGKNAREEELRKRLKVLWKEKYGY